MKWQQILLDPRERMYLERVARIQPAPVTLVPIAVEIKKIVDEEVAEALAGKQKRRKPK